MSLSASRKRPEGVCQQKEELLINSAQNILQGTGLAEMTLFSPNTGAGRGRRRSQHFLFSLNYSTALFSAWLPPWEIKHLDQMPAIAAPHREESRDPAQSWCEPWLTSSPGCKKPMAWGDLSPRGMFRPSGLSSAELSRLALAVHLFERAQRAILPAPRQQLRPAALRNGVGTIWHKGNPAVPMDG